MAAVGISGATTLAMIKAFLPFRFCNRECRTSSVPFVGILLWTGRRREAWYPTVVVRQVGRFRQTWIECLKARDTRTGTIVPAADVGMDGRP